MNAQNCVESNESPLHWDSEAKIELQNIPGFVRKKVQKNTENYAKKLGINLITLNVFYSAKESLEAKR
jgi:light-independent protochlorophyllide reductase subunit B